jgi:hypothetical protein
LARGYDFEQRRELIAFGQWHILTTPVSRYVSSLRYPIDLIFFAASNLTRPTRRINASNSRPGTMRCIDDGQGVCQRAAYQMPIAISAAAMSEMLPPPAQS